MSNTVSQKPDIMYFGIGVFANREAGEGLFGKDTPSRLVEIPGDLTVLNRKDIPSNIMPHDPNFRMYVLKLGEGRVQVRAWALTAEQLVLANEYNFGEEINRQVVKEAQFADGNKIKLVVDIYEGENGERVEGRNYDHFLNNREEVMEGIRKERAAFLEKSFEGSSRLSKER